MEKYKALTFDVDDTITESCQPIQYETTRILQEIPAEIGFVTGTDVSELKRMISSRLERRHHLLANTGTHYVVIEGNLEREILRENLTSEQKEELILAIKKLKGKYNLVPLTSEEDQILNRGSQITLSILGRNAPSDKKSSYDPDKKKREVMLVYLRTLIDPKMYETTIGGTSSIDITLKGKDKCEALKMFMKQNGFLEEEVLFFGDKLQPGGNDYSAIRSGVKCIEVQNPRHTVQILKELYNL